MWDAGVSYLHFMLLQEPASILVQHTIFLTENKCIGLSKA